MRMVRIALDDRARDIALASPSVDADEPRPAARVILQHASAGPVGSRIVTCTVAEARVLLDYFGARDTLAGLNEAETAVCAAARDGVRRALGFAGQ